MSTSIKPSLDIAAKIEVVFMESVSTLIQQTQYSYHSSTPTILEQKATDMAFFIWSLPLPLQHHSITMKLLRHHMCQSLLPSPPFLRPFHPHLCPARSQYFLTYVVSRRSEGTPLPLLAFTWALVGHWLGIGWALVGHWLGIGWALVGHRLYQKHSLLSWTYPKPNE